jgi:polysaccharide biosynthesis protein PslH
VKILFLAHRIPYPPNKGEKTRCFYELKALAKDHSIDLFCFADSEKEAREGAALKQWCRKVHVEVLAPRTGLVRAALRAASGLPASVCYYNSPRMRSAVHAACQTEKYDLIFVYCSSVAQFVPQPFPAPVVIDFVDADSAKWKQYARYSSFPKSWLYSRESRLLAAYERQIAELADVSLVTTRQELDDLGGEAKCPRVEVVENGVSQPPGEAVVPFEVRELQPYILFVGTMSYRPNADAVTYFAKEIFPLVQQAKPNVRFLIVGRDPTGEVQALAERSGVSVTGSVPDVHGYLLGAACAVAPFRIAQGVQNKVLEALITGIPVVLTSRPARAIPDGASDLLLIADSPKDFASAVLRAIDDPHYAERALAAVLRMRELLSWTPPLEKLSRLVRDAAAGKASRFANKAVQGSSPDAQLVLEGKARQ